MSTKISFDNKIINEIILLYEAGEMGTRKIGTQFNVSREVIQRILKENNIKLKSKGQRWKGGRVAAQKRYEAKPENKKRRNEYYKDWAKENVDYRKEYHKQWREDNIDYVREYKRKKQAEYMQDPAYRLAQYTRTAVWTCLKEQSVTKYQSTFDILPYTLEELMSHLELLFDDKMTWDNYGEWHVDHRTPMSYFTFESETDPEFITCWSLENLKPMWGIENISKNNRFVD